jgi:hypothetical protein
MNFLKVCAVLVLLSASSANAAYSIKVEEFSGYLTPQYFQWEEFLRGERLLREQGWLTGAGGTVALNVRNGGTKAFILTGKAEIFGGIVGYDGQTQPPNPLPVTTDVDYIGTREEVDLGLRIGDPRLSVEPFAGLGFRWWLRNLQDSTTVDTQGDLQEVSGYTERWLSSYVRLGTRLGWTMNTDWRAFAEGGGKIPFYTSNSVDLTNDGTVTIHPRGRWAAFAEVGTTYRRLKASAFYEGFRFDQSTGVRSGSDILFQPESNSDIYGVRLGWIFK